MRLDCPFSYSDAIQELGIETIPIQHIGHLQIIISNLESLASNDSVSALDGHGGKLVAIKGDWGTGKTSVILAIAEYFRHVHGWPTVFFPAWRYHQEQHPIIPLLLKLRDLASGRVKGRLTELIRIIGIAVTAGASAIVSHLTKVNLGEKVDLSTINQILNLIGKSTFEYYSKFEDIHKGLDRCVSKILEGRSAPLEEGHPLAHLKPESASKPEPHLLVVVDDLDRLFPDNALTLIENIRFFFDLKRTIVLFGVNDQVLTGAVSQRFGNLFPGESFIEKIFVWSYELQPVSFEWNYMKSFHFKDIATRLECIKKEIRELSSLDALPHRKWVRIANRCENYLSVLGAESPGLVFDSLWLGLLYEIFPRLELYLRPYPFFYLNPAEIFQRDDITSIIEGDRAVIGEPMRNFDFLRDFFANRP